MGVIPKCFQVALTQQDKGVIGMGMPKAQKLSDLIEFRWDSKAKVFHKIRTIKTNVPRAIAFDEKQKLIAQFGVINRPAPIRYLVCPNGKYQYTNIFKPFAK